MGQKNFSCRHSNPALRNVDFLLSPHLVTVTEPWISATVKCGDDEGDEITKYYLLCLHPSLSLWLRDSISETLLSPVSISNMEQFLPPLLPPTHQIGGVLWRKDKE